ncbi:MAG: tetratricopeptide repeat protein [Planctomycetota bacterium]|jgi:hypothetical protein
MNSAEKIKRLFAKSDVTVSSKVDDKIINDALSAFDKSEETKPVSAGPNIWRIIMKSRITKLAAAAVIVLAAIIGFNIFRGTPVWAIGQTIEALENVHSAIATGECTLGKRTYNFKLYIKADPNKPYLFDGRVEADQIIGVVHDNTAYDYELGCGEIYAYDLEKRGGKGVGTKLWHEMMKNAPWIIPIAPTMFQAAKVFSSDWQEVYKTDDVTARECVFVTGSYEPLSASFLIVFDLETKLIVRVKYWTNANREGTPDINIVNIVYNEEISDEIFDLEKTTGAKVVNEEGLEKRVSLWREALSLEDKKQYTAAIKVYQQLYEKYPQFIKTPEALVLMAICYREMGQYDKAIEYFEKVPREYSAPRYAVLDGYRLLGRCYMTTGEDAKALEAFQKCLELIGEWDPEGLRWKKAKELTEKDMQKINNKKK